MKIGIVGYGRMGRLIREVCLERGHSVPLIVDPHLPDPPADTQAAANTAEADLQLVDSVIDFSLPEGIEANIERYAQAGVQAVIGTTGWDEARPRMQKLVTEHGSSLLWGHNFSVGANIFFAMTERMAELVNGFPQYDVVMHELHHRNKKDSPSGTALTAAGRILDSLERKKTIQRETLQREVYPAELHVTATRGGSFPGMHMVLADAPEDTIELRHTARSRRGFALGAVLGAEWLQTRTGFYSIDDYFREALR